MGMAQLQALGRAHWPLVACCVLYLAWWATFFRPRAARPQGLEYGIGVALIVGAVACGLVAVIRIVGALGTLPNVVPGWALWPCAIAAYVVLAVVTSRLLGRPITTELLLIVAWSALEISVVGAATACWADGPVAVLVALVVVGLVCSMGCYLAYYHLGGWAAFLDGCGPLVVVGIVAAAFAMLL